MQQIIELVVAEDNLNQAKKHLNSLGFSSSHSNNYRRIKGLYIFKLALVEGLTEAQFKEVKKSAKLSILSDSWSIKNASVVLREVSRTENQLRRLLLHVLDIVEFYYDVMGKSKYTKQYVKTKSINLMDDVNPVTSHLTLGEMISILEYDLSWRGKVIDTQMLTLLLDKCKNLDELRLEIISKAKSHNVWEVIAENVLETSMSWSDLGKDLRVLKDIRDKAAHNLIVTKSDEATVRQIVKKLDIALTPKKRLRKQHILNLSRLSEQFQRSFISELSGSRLQNINHVVRLSSDIISSNQPKEMADFAKLISNNLSLYEANKKIAKAINDYSNSIINFHDENRS